MAQRARFKAAARDKGHRVLEAVHAAEEQEPRKGNEEQKAMSHLELRVDLHLGDAELGAVVAQRAAQVRARRLQALFRMNETIAA